MFCCFALLFCVSARAQIVNIESKRMQSDTTGWMGNLGAAFSFTKNVQEVITAGLHAHLQFKTERDLYLFLSNYNLLKGAEQELVNNVFYHLRYNRKLNAWLRWEVFTQW